MNMIQELMEQIRIFLQLQLPNLSDEDKCKVPLLFDKWEADTEYMVEDIVRYEDVLYRCLTQHVSQAAWTPDVSGSLWAKVLTDIENGTVLEWEQPDSTNPYMTGDKVLYNGQTWVSIVDNNVWVPGSYGWETV